MKIPRQMRLSKHLLKHPGTWILGALIAVGVAMLVPFLAPALVTLAAVLMGIAAIAFIPYAMNFIKHPIVGPKGLHLYENFLHKHLNGDFFKHHPLQGAVILMTAAAFMVALVLTIGFFTGGAGFTFMAPVFSAISAPFAMAAAAAHIPLFVPALGGFCFVMTPLVIGNHLKRFLGWLDSFKYDAMSLSTLPLNNYTATSRVKIEVNEIIKTHGYFPTIFHGIKETVYLNPNKFSSYYQDKKEEAIQFNAKKNQ